MRCPECGYGTVPDDARFCPNCGTALDKAPLPQPTDKIIDYRDLIARNTTGFVGRRWVREAVDAFLQADGPRAFLLLGEPGSGKTSFMADLVQRRGYPHHFIGKGSQIGMAASLDWRDPVRFAESIGYQLLRDYGGWIMNWEDWGIHVSQQVQELEGLLLGTHVKQFGALPRPADRPVLSVEQEVERFGSTARAVGVYIERFEMDVEQVVRQLLTTPLRTIAERWPEHRVVLLVDGLDEAEGYSNPQRNILKLLPNGSLPGNVRLLLSSRPGEHLTHDFLQRVQPFWLSEDEQGWQDPGVMEDAQAYLGALVEEESVADALARQQAEPETLTERVAEASQGNFLYLYHYAQGVRTGDESLLDLASLPQGLHGIYGDFLSKIRAGIGLEFWVKAFKPVLGTLAVAREPLTGRQIANFSRVEHGTVGTILLRLKQFLDRVGEQRYSIYHISFGEYLVSELNQDTIDGEAAHERIVAFYRGIADDWEHVQWDQVDDYGLRYLGTHLSTLRHHDAYRESFSELLSEIGFLERKTARFGVYATLADLRSGISALTESPQARQPLIRWLQVLDREAHNLRGWSLKQAPAFFAQQAHNQAVQLGMSDLAERAAERLAQIGRRHLALRFRISNESPALLRVLSGHGSSLSYVLATPDGAYALAGSRETLKIWNVETGQELIVFDGSWRAIGFTDDGQKVILSHNGSLVLWDLGSNREVGAVASKGDWSEGLAVTSDGRRVLCLSAGHRLRLVDLETGEVVHHFDGPGQPIEHIVLTPDDRIAATAAQMDTLSEEEEENYALRLWDLEAGHELPAFTVPPWIRKLSVMPDGRALIASYGSEEIRVWDLETRQEIITYEIRYPGAFAVSPQGRFVVYAYVGEPYELRIVDRRSRQEVGALAAHPYPSNDLTITADGHYLISCCGTGELKVWDWQAVEASLGEPYTADQGANMWLRGLTPDGRRALLTSRENALHLLDLESGRLVCAPMTGHEGIVRGVAFTSDSRYVVSASDDDTLKVWDLDAGHQVQAFPGYGFNGCVAVLPGDRYVLSVSLDKELIVRDLKSGQVVGEALALEDYPDAIALTVDGRRVLVAVSDAIVVWDLTERRVLHTFPPAHDPILKLIITPDDRMAFSVGYDSPVIGCYDLAAGETLPGLEGHDVWARTIAATSDSQHAVSCANDGKLIVWDLRTGRAVRHLDDHTDWVYDMALTADDRLVFSASQDGTVRAWDWRTGEAVARADLGGVLDRLRVTPEGQRVVVEERSGIIYCLDYVEPADPAVDGRGA